MNIFSQRALSVLQIRKAEFGFVLVLMKHVDSSLFGDAKTAAMKVLGG